MFKNTLIMSFVMFLGNTAMSKDKKSCVYEGIQIPRLSSSVSEKLEEQMNDEIDVRIERIRNLLAERNFRIKKSRIRPGDTTPKFSVRLKSKNIYKANRDGGCASGVCRDFKEAVFKLKTSNKIKTTYITRKKFFWGDIYTPWHKNLLSLLDSVADHIENNVQGCQV